MPSPVRSSSRVLVVGGGVAGLAVAVRLAQSGRAVTVFERSKLGAGASTRNQGWLHSGAAFAVDQPGIARLCYDSLRETLRFCPGCVEPGHDGAVFLLSDDGADPDRWLRAWSELGIPHRPFPPGQLRERVPRLAPSAARHAFLLPDRSVRVDLLLRHLAAAAEQAGAEVRPATEAVRLLRNRNTVYGVVTGLGEEVTGRLVVLAVNTRSATLLPEFVARTDGEESTGHSLVALKAHLIAVEPALTAWPICLPEADGFNHLPHPPRSVFGTSRWLPAESPADERPVEEEFEWIRRHVARLFPASRGETREAAAWAGTTMQAIPPGHELPKAISWPTVIDHSREPEPVHGVLSVFPGRATLWARLAEEALRVVSAKLGGPPPEVAVPPWQADATDGPPAPERSPETVAVYHCQKCGRVQRRAPGLQTPVCCETAMVRVADAALARPI
ncbi:MAG TPA: FAD-dependent oxidoreductase [Planctomycetaceae bacterium]